MDSALRAAAEKRRAEQGADFAIPPATLRTLQQEAARAYPEDPGEESSPGWLSALWPKLGLVAALAGLAALAVVFFDARPGKSFDLAGGPSSPQVSPHDTVRLADAEMSEEENRRPSLAKKAASETRNFGAAPGATPAPAPSAPAAQPEQVDALAATAAPAQGLERSLALLAREESSQAKAAPVTEALARQQPAVAPLDRASRMGLQGGTAPEARAEDKYGIAANDAAAPVQLGVEVRGQSPEARRFAADTATPPAASAPPQPLASALSVVPQDTPAPAPANAGPSAEALRFAGTETLVRNEPSLNTPAIVASSASAPALRQELEEAKDLSDTPENAPFNRGFAALQSPSYYFTQTPVKTRMRPNLNSPPTPQVLNFFAVQNAGNALRIRDSDGSIYEGAILPAAASPEEKLGDREAVAQAQEANAGNLFNFRAFGLNQTLQQNVEVSGSVIPQAVPAVALKEQAPAQVGRARAAAAPAQALKNAPDESLFQNSRIEGTVTVGNNRIRIEAQQVATPPPTKK